MKLVRRVAAILALAATALILVAGGLLFTGNADYSVYIVDSNSMAPEIPVGSIVVVDETAQIQEGDVVTYRVNEEDLTTHRLIAINPDGTIVTQGDAMDQVDPWVVTTDDIVGEVVAVYPNLGQAVVFLSTPAGFASVALATVAAGILLSVLTSHKKDEHEDSPTEQDRQPVPIS